MSTNKRLMILRHAKAVPWRPAVEDFPRALSKVGLSHASRIATWLSEHLDLPDEILCSPSVRNRETLAPLLSLRPELESRTRFVPQIYGASLRTLLALLDGAFAENDRIMMVGHNPGFESLAFEVLSRSEGERLERLPTGTLLVVDFPAGWPDDSGRGVLVRRVRGKML